MGRVDGDASAVERSALDDAGELVPEHERLGQPGIPDAALAEPVQIGSAQADGRHADQTLAVGRRRWGLVGDADVTETVQPGNPHDRLTDSPTILTPRGHRPRGCRPLGRRPQGADGALIVIDPSHGITGPRRTGREPGSRRTGPRLAR